MGLPESLRAEKTIASLQLHMNIIQRLYVALNDATAKL